MSRIEFDESFEALGETSLTKKNRTGSWPIERPLRYGRPFNRDNRRDTLPSVSPWHQEASFPSLREYFNGLPLEQKLLGEGFVFSGGPIAIFHQVATLSTETELRKGLENKGLFQYAIMTAGVGVAFERLAHLWLSDKFQGDKTMVLDPGSCGRIFTDLRQEEDEASFVPDGMIIDYQRDTSIIKALCEYKTNPNSQATQPKLERRIRKLKKFISASRDFGKIPVGVSLDETRRLRSKFLKTARNCEIILVIPEDRPITAYEGVTVYHTPFPSWVVGEITRRSLIDILMRFNSKALPLESAFKKARGTEETTPRLHPRYTPGVG